MKLSNKNINYCVGLFNGEISFYNSNNNKIYTNPNRKFEDNKHKYNSC